MTWCRIGDKPLSEPLLTQFDDAYICGGDKLTLLVCIFTIWHFIPILAKAMLMLANFQKWYYSNSCSLRFPMYRFWLHGLHRAWCLKKKQLNLIAHSLIPMNNYIESFLKSCSEHNNVIALLHAKSQLEPLIEKWTMDKQVFVWFNAPDRFNINRLYILLPSSVFNTCILALSASPTVSLWRSIPDICLAAIWPRLCLSALQHFMHNVCWNLWPCTCTGMH